VNLIRRLLCRHPRLRTRAATGACLVLDGGNVTVGIIIKCVACGRGWFDDVEAKCPEAYGKRSQETPRPWPLSDAGREADSVLSTWDIRSLGNLHVRLYRSGVGPWREPEDAINHLHDDRNCSDPAELGCVLVYGDHKDEITLNNEQYERRMAFERECTCHLSPPCGNCIDQAELFPENN